MKHLLPCPTAVVVCLLAVPPLAAQSPTTNWNTENGRSGQADASRPSATPTRIGGTVSRPCVLLKNDNVLFGHAYQVGELVIVRTGLGSEVQLSRKDVACWADSPRDLYQFRVDRRQKGDPEAHLRDARWCLTNDLFDLAENELRALRRLAPQHAELARLEQELRRLTAPRTAAYVTPRTTGSSVVPAAYGSDSSHTSPTVSDPATIARFTANIQPLLINRCSRCHGDKPNAAPLAWTMALPPTGTRASAPMTRRNLTSLMPFVDPVDPHQSLLLLKATSPHGGTSAPLAARNVKAIHALKSWLTLVSQNLSRPEPAEASDNRVINQVSAATDAASSDSALAEAADQPSRLPQVANPFDPELFNRRFHRD